MPSKASCTGQKHSLQDGQWELAHGCSSCQGREQVGTMSSTAATRTSLAQVSSASA